MLAPERMESLASLPLLIIDDIDMRKLPLTPAEEPLDRTIGWCGSMQGSLLQLRISAQCSRHEANYGNN